MDARAADLPQFPPFSEKGFYLGEFRGRTLAVAAAAGELRRSASLTAVLDELRANATRVVLISTDAAVLEAFVGLQVLAADAPRLEGAVWHGLRAASRVGVCVRDEARFPRTTGEIALRLGVTKLVWIDAGGALLDAGGRRLSFVDLGELRQALRAAPPGAHGERGPILREIEAVLSAGLPAVNLCSAEGLGDELFTYAGSGTLFSRERYVEVRRLGIDDFDAADDLVARGVSEGYLVPRSPEQIEAVLANGFGAFVEGRHLAGIGALVVYEEANVAEIVSLYTLTRFLGEGIGAHLVDFACRRARELSCRSIAAVTTSEHVVDFFERNGFQRIDGEALPAEKWREYDPARRARARCLRRDL